MNDTIKAIHLADPVAWARMRLDPRRRNSRGIPRTYEDPAAAAYRENLAYVLLFARNKAKWGPPSPTSLWGLSLVFQCETYRAHDLDRLTSLVMDAATGVIYEDDTQVREFREPFKWIPGLPKGGGRTEIVFHYLGETPKRKRK